MRKTDTLIAGLLSVALAALLVPFARIGVDPHHDGIMLKPALDVLSGQVLFRDTFMQYGALTCLLQVAALWIHPTLLAIKLLTVAAYATTFFFLYATWRMLLPRLLTVAACALYVLFIPFYELRWTMIPWSSEFALMFQVVALYALGRIITGQKPLVWAFVFGLTTASVFWCRQSVGVVTCGAVPVIWFVLKRSGWVWPAGTTGRAMLTPMALGFVGVNALLLGAISVSGALPNWWFQNFVWPKRWALEGTDNWALGAPFYLHPGRGVALLVIFLLLAAPGLMNRVGPIFSFRHRTAYYTALACLLLLAHKQVLSLLIWPQGAWSTAIPLGLALQAAIVIGWATLGKSVRVEMKDHLVMAFSGIALASVLQYYPVPCTRHIFWSLAPGFGLFVYLLWRATCWRPVILVLVLGLAFGPLLKFRISEARAKLSQPLTTVTAPAVLAGMRVNPEEARVYESIAAALRPLLERAPMTPSALFGADAIYLCFTPNRTNPSPYFVLWKGLLDDQPFSDRWNRIIEMRPILFIQNPRKEQVNQFYAEENYAPVLHIASAESSLSMVAPAELVNSLAKPNGPSSAQRP